MRREKVAEIAVGLGGSGVEAQRRAIRAFGLPVTAFAAERDAQIVVRVCVRRMQLDRFAVVIFRLGQVAAI